jgi:peptidoglycan/LPS O-acetylase OafA/YrhL
MGRLGSGTEDHSGHVRPLGRVPALDAVRGLAIVLVLSMHSGNVVPGGAMGVDLFFVLSGFLITSLLVAEWSSRGRISLRAFYRRRALRLVPALALMLLVVTALTAVFDPADFRDTLVAAAAGITYIANVVQAAHGTFEVPWLMPLWSLANEEQFYLVWPPVLIVLLALKVRPRTIALALTAAALASVLWRFVLLSEHASLQRLWFGSDTHADPILVGCAAGIAYSFGLVRRVRWAWVAFVGGGVIVALVPFLSPLTLLVLPLFAAACAVVVLACVLEPASLLVRALDQAPLRFFGKISYALYLWQLPIYVAIGWQRGLPVAIVVAALSTFCVERMFSGAKTSFAGRRKSSEESVPQPSLVSLPALTASSQ